LGVQLEGELERIAQKALHRADECQCASASPWRRLARGRTIIICPHRAQARALRRRREQFLRRDHLVEHRVVVVEALIERGEEVLVGNVNRRDQIDDHAPIVLISHDRRLQRSAALVVGDETKEL
jgi:hypothetical protein